MNQQALVVFMPSGKRGYFALGHNLLAAARSLGVDVDSVCGGRAICGRCQVAPMWGDFPKHGIRSAPTHLSVPSSVEINYADLRGNRRLTCQAHIQGDLLIDVPPESQVHKQVVRKGVETHDIALDPETRLYYVEVAEPNMHEPTGDWQRVQEALEFEWGFSGVEAPLHLLQNVQNVLRQGQWKATLALHAERNVVAIWPGLKTQIYGLAVDIGSTTIAAQLCDLTSGEVVAAGGLMNPQIRFGEDVMSRVSYAMMNPDGVQALTTVVRQALNTLSQDLAQQASISVDDILEAAVVGNPIMHHLLLGMSPVELGGAPFALASDAALRVSARELEWTLNPGASIYVLPCIAGHVGADTAAMVLAERPDQSEVLTLLVDVGTNAEIVLGNQERLLACSSPTGPAFEGAQISSGQRAAPGAIERVRIDKTTLEPRFKVIGCDLWSDQGGFEAAVTALSDGVTGICGSAIIELVAEAYLAGIVHHDGSISSATQNPRLVKQGRTFAYQLLSANAQRTAILLTQNDVRAIQLAKAALYAGVRLLMQHLHVERVAKIRLAGAFGSHIDVFYAMVLGMIPDCRLEQVSSAGNVAGTGARIALLNRGARQDIERIVRRIEKIETAVKADFQTLFVEAMALPHLHHPFDELRKTVALPERRDAELSVNAVLLPGARRPSRRRARS